jgi:aryl-alcohol dehydrogenase-like predicted oxidoreductase
MDAKQPSVTAAIVGFRGAKQFSGIIAAAEFQLHPREMLEPENVQKPEVAA